MVKQSYRIEAFSIGNVYEDDADGVLRSVLKIYILFSAAAIL